MPGKPVFIVTKFRWITTLQMNDAMRELLAEFLDDVEDIYEPDIISFRRALTEDLVSDNIASNTIARTTTIQMTNVIKHALAQLITEVVDVEAEIVALRHHLNKPYCPITEHRRRGSHGSMFATGAACD